MNYHLYYLGNQFEFTFNFINTVGDLQTVILQALNIQKSKLLFLSHGDKILGKDYLFTDNLADKELFDINIFVVPDYYEVEDGTKRIYNEWLNNQIVNSDLITANQQLLLFNTNNNLTSPNLHFFTNDQQPRPRRHRSPLRPSRPPPPIPSEVNTNRRVRRAAPNGNGPLLQSFFGGSGSLSIDGAGGNNQLQQMIQNFLGGSDAGSTTSLSNIFNEMINNDIYDLGVTMTHGPNGNSIGVVASGSVGGNDFFRRLLSDLEPVPITLSRENIEELPTFKYSEVPDEIKEPNADGTCSICLEEFNGDDEVRVLLCKHYFHKTCIDRWLGEENVRCPLCRHDSREISSNNNNSLEDNTTADNDAVSCTSSEEGEPRRRKKKKKSKLKSGD